MTTVLGPTAVSLKSGLTTFGPVTIADTIQSLKATFAHWAGNATLGMHIDLSFDGGTTWRTLVAISPMGSPTGIFKGETDLFLAFDIPRVCACGELYIPGHPANTQLTAHSDHAFRDTTALPNLSSVVFHNPDNQPMSLPLRQGRVIAQASGNISSTLTVDVT